MHLVAMQSSSLQAASSRQAVRCSAPQAQLAEPRVMAQPTSRRSLLALVPLVASATLAVGDASAVVSRWDGESAASGSCALGEAGAECRQELLQRDRAGGLESYDSAIDNSKKASRQLGTGMTVDDKYTNDTLELESQLRTYLTIDPYDPTRGPLVKQLKTDGLTWTSKYARGGSIRSLSGRKMYIVVDSVLGHMASNGLAPLPPSKASKLVADLDATLDLLAQAK